MEAPTLMQSARYQPTRWLTWGNLGLLLWAVIPPILQATLPTPFEQPLVLVPYAAWIFGSFILARRAAAQSTKADHSHLLPPEEWDGMWFEQRLRHLVLPGAIFTLFGIVWTALAFSDAALSLPLGPIHLNFESAAFSSDPFAWMARLAPGVGFFGYGLYLIRQKWLWRHGDPNAETSSVPHEA